MQELSSCPVCEGTKFQDYLSCEDHTVSHETFKIVKCQTCELAITTPQPNEDTLAKYYISNDYISHTSNANSLIDRIYLVARSFTLDKKLNLISKYHKQGKLLDYGCGTGEFINHCKSNSWTVSGLEPSELARNKAEQLTGQPIKASPNDIGKEKYDVITLWHVLEHVPTFEQTIKQLSNSIDKDGVLIIAVPNYLSFDSQLYKQLWAGYDVPRHLWHFTPTAIKKLLAKNSLTLKEIVPMKLDSYYVSLLSEKYKRKKQTIPGMISAFFNGLRSNLKARSTGNYSSLIYIIKK